MLVNIFGFLCMSLTTLVSGVSLATVCGWRKAAWSDLMVMGYVALLLPTVAFSFILPGTLLGVMGLWVPAALTLVVAISPAHRASAGKMLRQLSFADLSLWALVVLIVGWPFLGPCPAAPWGTANSDLFDGFAGGLVTTARPDLVPLYQAFNHGASNWGQYVASAIAFIIGLGPSALLADYWHLILLHAISASMVATLAREGLNAGPFRSWLAGIMTGFSCLLTITIYNGHVGSTIFIPLVLFCIRLGFVPPADAGMKSRIFLIGSVFLLIFLTYAYAAPLFISAAVLVMIIQFLHHRRCPSWLVRMGLPGILCALVIICVLGMLVIYPSFEGYREAATQRYRAWAIALRPEMLGILWGLEPYGLCQATDEVRHPFEYFFSFFGTPITLAIKVLTVVAAFVILIIGILRSRSSLLGVFIYAYCLTASLFFVAVRYVVQDSYYCYKIIYISFPVIVLALIAAADPRHGRRLAAAAMSLMLILLAFNVAGVGANAIELTRADFNHAAEDVVAVLPHLRHDAVLGQTPQVSVTSEELASMAEHFSLREGIKLPVNRWAYSESFKTALEMAVTDADRVNRIKRLRQAEAEKLIGDQDRMLESRRLPEIVSFQGMEAREVWGNGIWRLIDRSGGPAIETFSYFSSVSRYPSSLNGRPFRWMRDRMAFLIRRWPSTHRRLSFYAEAGCGSTSGQYDLTVTFAGVPLVHRVIPYTGAWVEAEIPDTIAEGSVVLDFTGFSVSGPPLLRREFINLRARLAEISFAPIGAPPYSRAALGIFNQAGDLAILPAEGGSGVFFGPGWGPVEMQDDKPLHWLTDKPAAIVVLRRSALQQAIRLSGRRGPGAGDGGVVEIVSTAGWTRKVPIRDREVFIRLDPPKTDANNVDEVLSLTFKSEDSAAFSTTSEDPRRLVFRLDRFESIP